MGNSELEKFKGITINQNLLMRSSNRLLAFVLAACLTAALTKAIVLFIYVPLQVDGGWAAYSALALSRGGSATENTKELDELIEIEGLTIKHGFDDRSIRLLPMALWFQKFGYGIVSCRVYSLFEYLFLMAASYAFFRNLSGERRVAVLVFGLFLTDKSAAWMIADLRPDVLLAGLAVLGFTLYDRSDGIPIKTSYWLSILMLMAMAMIWPSSPIPLAIIFVYFGTDVLLRRTRGNGGKRNVGPYALFVMFPTIAFFLRENINRLLFGHFEGEAVSWKNEIVGIWSRGLGALVEKEVTRWSDYFINSNILLFLVVIAASLGMILVKLRSRRKDIDRFWRLTCGVLAGAFVMLLVDPHVTQFHLIPVAPFLLGCALLGLKELVAARRSVMALTQGVALACVAVSILFSLRTAHHYQRIGFTNKGVVDLVEKTMPDIGEKLFAIGPAELFPYMHPKGALTLMDNRSGSKLEGLDPYKFKYVFINKEYDQFGFLNKFADRFPKVELVQIAELGALTKGPEHLRIFEVSDREGRISQERDQVLGEGTE